MLTSLLIAEKQLYPEARCRVVSLSSGGANSQKLRAEGIHVTELGMKASNLPAWGLFRLARQIWLEKPAVIQSWMYHADLAATFALYWSSRRHETRLLWGLRCSDMDTRRYGLRLSAVIRGCALLSSIPDAIVSNSVSGQKYHMDLGYPENRFVIIPNGIDVDRFRPNNEMRAKVRAELGIKPDEPLIAHVARVDPMKDHACFIEALKSLPGTKALLIGQGTDALTPLSSLYRLGRRDDVPQLLCAADLVVSSSAFGEGFSNAIAEGMASGLPAVATDTGDAREIVGDTGIIVPPRNSTALADGIRTILNGSPADRHVRKEAARHRIVELFSLRRAVMAFRDLHKAA